MSDSSDDGGCVCLIIIIVVLVLTGYLNFSSSCAGIYVSTEEGGDAKEEIKDNERIY